MQFSTTQRTSKAYKNSKIHKTYKTSKTSYIHIYQYSAASSLCGFTTLFGNSTSCINTLSLVFADDILEPKYIYIRIEMQC